MTRRHLLRSSLVLPASFAVPGAVSPLLAQGAAAAAPSIFKLDPLPYAADALEPHIDAQTMTIHHDKHHAAYVTKLNEALAKLSDKPQGTWDELTGWLSNLDKVPEDIRTAVRNHGGGHFNHTLFWNSLKKGGSKLSGSLQKAVEGAFKSQDALLTEMQDKGGKVFGSGWVWLCHDPKAKQLAVTTTPNQDTPLAAGHVPLFGIDVWEHAYYLKYQNKRADYLKAIVNVIDWAAIGERYEKAVKA